MQNEASGSHESIDDSLLASCDDIVHRQWSRLPVSVVDVVVEDSHTEERSTTRQRHQQTTFYSYTSPRFTSLNSTTSNIHTIQMCNFP